MVIVNDFQFKIVSARDKTPFKEHQKGGNTYVEVEPDAEYLLSVRKIRRSSTDLKCYFKVDETGMPTYKIFKSSENQSTYYKGISSRAYGRRHVHAFKFVKASFASDKKGIGSTMTGMGKVEMNVYVGHYAGMKKKYDAADTASFKASTIEIDDNATVTMKKNLRSGEGDWLKTTRYDMGKKHKLYSKGSHLYTITLNYCATPGLIAVGILPKPPFWDWKRMQFPANTTAEEKEKLDKAVISVKRNQGNEILELADSDSDSDDGIENAVRPDRVPSNRKKFKR